ncbi:MAG: hypothetical protein ACRCYY_19260 [Trueperaceae bacterium]
MSPTEIVVDYSKHLEHILEKNFGAQGRGLHSKISSVEHLLPDKLVKQLRFLASIRNKVVHDYTYKLDKNPKDLQRTANEAIAELTRVSKRKSGALAKRQSRPFIWIFLAVFVVLVFFVYRFFTTDV